MIWATVSPRTLFYWVYRASPFLAEKNTLDLISVLDFPGGSDSMESAYKAGDPGSTLGLGRSPGEGNGKPLQYSCLENPMDEGAWWAAVHGVAKSWTQLSDFTFTFIFFQYWPPGDSMCRVMYCVVGRGCLLWPVCSLGKTLLAFALLHFVLQGQTCLLLQVSLDFLLLHSSLLWWKGHVVFCVFFGVISRRSCRSS